MASNAYVPYPLEGSYISETYGIYIRTRRNADAIRLMSMAIDMGCFTYDGNFGDIFRLEREGDVWVYRTVNYPKVTVYKYLAEKFCRLYGLDWQEFDDEYLEEP